VTSAPKEILSELVSVSIQTRSKMLYMQQPYSWWCQGGHQTSLQDGEYWQWWQSDGSEEKRHPLQYL